MERMGKEICLDTDILIDLLDGEEKIPDKFIDFKIHITSISAFEYSLGKVSYDQSLEVLSKFVILDLGIKEGILAADIFKDLKGKNLELDFRDVMIASICIINDVPLFTRNLNHFQRLKEYGLKLVE